MFAGDEELETDAQAFDCDTCRVADELDALCPENRRAWRLSRQVFTRFAVDTHTVPFVLRHLTDGWTSEDACDLVTRLALIYDEVCPPPKRGS